MCIWSLLDTALLNSACFVQFICSILLIAAKAKLNEMGREYREFLELILQAKTCWLAAFAWLAWVAITRATPSSFVIAFYRLQTAFFLYLQQIIQNLEQNSLELAGYPCDVITNTGRSLPFLTRNPVHYWENTNTTDHKIALLTRLRARCTIGLFYETQDGADVKQLYKAVERVLHNTLVMVGAARPTDRLKMPHQKVLFLEEGEAPGASQVSEGCEGRI